MPTLPSHTIGDYIPMRTLGSGATGKVKLARHSRTGKLVALKIVRSNLLNTNPSLYQKVRREIAVLKLVAACVRRARKPNPELMHNAIGVMQLLDVYQYDNSFVLVLEYCNGGELFDKLIERGFFPEDVVLDYFQQLVYALDFCHNRGICHRDLKPENVILTKDGHLKLADFGMATMLTPGTLLQTSCGSPQYCAPEVITGMPYDGRTSDVWSLGVILYAMSTGGLPFDDDNLHRLANKIQSGAFYMPPEVPVPIAELIRSMLVVDPADRFTLADIKKSTWFQSHPCRADILRDDDVVKKPKPYREPVAEPDLTILRYLVDLGLGDMPTIRRRIMAEPPCKERDYYYKLADASRDMLAFRSLENAPSSPKTSNKAPPEDLYDLPTPDAAVVARPAPISEAQSAALANAVAEDAIASAARAARDSMARAVVDAWPSQCHATCVSENCAHTVPSTMQVPTSYQAEASSVPSVQSR